MANAIAIERLFKSANIKEQIGEIAPIYYGGNNQLYVVNNKYVAKKYFRCEHDKRDRFTHEVRFLNYASEITSRFVPRLYSCDEKTGWALFEYLDGSALDSCPIDEALVDQAAEFFSLLNTNNPSSNLKKNALPLASEACFSISEHVDLVESRVFNLLGKLAKQKPDHLELDDYLNKLAKKLNFLKDKIRSTSADFGEYERLIENEEKCVSPSDFGFHNAIINSSLEVKFLDFEYAGIDDPAKMIADFFSQVAIPVDHKYFDFFVKNALRHFDNRDKIATRAKLLLPIYKLKWSCIMMNAFDPVHMARRRFSHPMLNEKEYKNTKLFHASSLLDSIN